MTTMWGAFVEAGGGILAFVILGLVVWGLTVASEKVGAAIARRQGGG